MERLCLFICCKYSRHIVLDLFQLFKKVNFRSPQTDGHRSVPYVLRSGGELFVRPSSFAPSCVLLHPSVCAQCHISPRVTVCPPNSNVGTPCGIHQHPHPPHRFLFLSHQPLLQHLQLRDFKLLKPLLLLWSTTVSIRLKPVVLFFPCDSLICSSIVKDLISFGIRFSLCSGFIIDCHFRLSTIRFVWFSADRKHPNCS